MKKSIDRKILLGVVLASTIITIFVTAFELMEDYRSQIEIKYSQFDTLMHVNGKALETSLWDLNTHQIKSIIDGYIAHPSVTYLELSYESVDGKDSIKLGEYSDSFLKKVYSLKVDKKEVGTITFHSNKGQIYDFLVKDLVKTVLINTTKTFLASFLILFIINQLLTKHLIQISKFIHKAEAGETDNLLSLNRLGGDNFNNDELTQLVSSINTYISKSKELKLNEINRVVSSTPSCMKIINSDGSLVHMNDVGLEIIGAESLESVKGKSVYNLIEDSFRESFVNMNEKVCKGEKQHLEFEIINLNGERRYLETYAAPYELSNGETAHIAITNDISEKIRIRKDIEEQRKVNLHNAKLASIGELAAGVGHEINNPLAIVKGYLGLLEKDLLGTFDPGNKVFKSIKKINIASDRIAKIVKSLRTYSRSDTSEVKLFNPITAVMESIDLFKDIYSQEKIELTFEGRNNDKEVFISGSRGKFQQVLVNLISNAKDAVQSSVTKSIKVVTYHDNSSEKLTIEVIDSGHGIPPKVLENIFDPFFTTKEIDKGTGIGLSLVRNFINDFGGKIKADSVEGEGAKFIIELPLKTLTQAQKQSQEQCQVKVLSRGLFKGRVLVVDDEEGVREILSDILKELGLEVLQAESGEKAFQIYSKESTNIDLIISDMQMNGMDGPALLKAVRNSGLRQPKLVIVTGGVNINFEDSENELSSLIDGYFFKPFDERSISSMLSEILGSCERAKVS